MRNILLSILFLVVSDFSFATDVVYVPDEKLRLALKQILPQTYFDANDYFYKDSVLNYTGELKLSYSSIEDLSSIEWFKKVRKIDFSHNFITSLERLALLDSLEELNCSYNLIANIPEFSNLKSLNILIANNNTIKSVGSFSLNNSLTKLILTHNELTSFPFKLGYSSINYLDLSNNRLSEFEINEGYLGLKNVFLKDNELRSVKIDPSFSLEKLHLTHNYIYFDEIEWMLDSLSIQEFLFSPQKDLITESTVVFTALTDTVIKIDVPFVEHVEYAWYKNGVFDTIVYVPELKLTNVSSSDQGAYYCQARYIETKMQSLNYQLGTIYVIVIEEPCKLFDMPSFQIIEELCDSVNYQFTLNKQLTYTLIDGNEKSVSVLDDLFISNGEYDLSISKEGCNTIHPRFITVESAFECEKEGEEDPDPVIDKEIPNEGSTIKDIPVNECERVFSPNSDGQCDSYIIHGVGGVVIYDKTGVVVNKFDELPAVWMGTDLLGNELKPGLYILVINGVDYKNITIIR